MRLPGNGAHKIRAPAEIAERRQPYFLPVGFLVVEVGLAELVLGLPPVAGLELPFQGSMGMGLLHNVRLRRSEAG
jgi:hypothetical protein